MPDFDVVGFFLLNEMGDFVVYVKMVIRNISIITKLFGHLQIIIIIIIIIIIFVFISRG